MRKGLVAPVASLVLFAPADALAVDIVVNRNSDTVANDGRCSLREAVRAANLNTASGAAAGECAAGAATDTITLPAGDHVLSIGGIGEDGAVSGDLDLAGTVTLTGAGASQTSVHGGGLDRVFDVLPSAVASISGVTVTGGKSPDGATGSGTSPGGPGQDGGGILNRGTLTLSDVVVSANTTGRAGDPGFISGQDGTGGNATGGPGAAGGDGGGVHTTGPLTIRASTIAGNTGGLGGTGVTAFAGEGPPGGQGGVGQGGAAGPGGVGGVGVDPTGTLTLVASTVSANTGGVGGRGGQGTGGGGGDGIGTGNAGPSNFGFGGLGGAGGAGGLGGAGPITVTTSTITDNTGGVGGRGGLGNAVSGGDATAPGDGGDGSAALGEEGGDGGPGGVGGSAVREISASVIAANVSGAGGEGGPGSGGLGGDGQPNGTRGSGIGDFGGDGGPGGGLQAGAGANRLTNVTLAANGTGAGGQGGTGSGGVATGGNGGQGGRGGGAAATGGTLTLTNVTLTGGALGGGGQGGFAQFGTTNNPGTGGAAGAASGLARLGGTGLEVRNSVISSATCAGSLTDGLRNIDFPDSTCPGTVADPRLGPLAPNGGPTNTFRLLPASAALDAVPGAGANCPATDQRGAVRPAGAACDGGAFELAPPGAATGGASGVTPAAATLMGTVTPRGLATSYTFEFGTTTAYGRTSAGGSSSAAGEQSVSMPVAALTADTTYHYRLVATGLDGTTRGADATFRTSTGPAAGAVSPTALTLTGLRVRPSRVKVGRRARITFRLSAAANVRLSIQQAARGVRLRVRGRTRCVQATKANVRRARRGGRRARRCTAYLSRGSLRPKGKAGANSVAFTGRVGRRKLRRARHRVVATARRASGGAATRPRSARFRIVR